MGPEEPKTNTLTIGGPGVTSQQSIVRLIDGADMRLSPGKHGQPPGARANHNTRIMGNYFDIYTIRDNTRITTAPGSPPTRRDTVVSNNDAANIVQELFVCAAFRTNKSFGRSLRARASNCLNQ